MNASISKAIANGNDDNLSPESLRFRAGFLFDSLTFRLVCYAIPCRHRGNKPDTRFKKARKFNSCKLLSTYYISFSEEKETEQSELCSDVVWVVRFELTAS